MHVHGSSGGHHVDSSDDDRTEETTREEESQEIERLLERNRSLLAQGPHEPDNLRQIEANTAQIQARLDALHEQGLISDTFYQDASWLLDNDPDGLEVAIEMLQHGVEISRAHASMAADIDHFELMNTPGVGVPQGIVSEEELSNNALLEAGSQIFGLFHGAADVLLIEPLKALVGLLDFAASRVGLLGAEQRELAIEEYEQAVQSFEMLFEIVKSDPGLGVEMIWDAVTQDIVDAWARGDYGYAAGRVVGEVLGFIVVPAKAAQAVGLTGKFARLASFFSKLDKLTPDEITRYSKFLDELATAAGLGVSGEKLLGFVQRFAQLPKRLQGALDDILARFPGLTDEVIELSDDKLDDLAEAIAEDPHLIVDEDMGEQVINMVEEAPEGALEGRYTHPNPNGQVIRLLGQGASDANFIQAMRTLGDGDITLGVQRLRDLMESGDVDWSRVAQGMQMGHQIARERIAAELLDVGELTPQLLERFSGPEARALLDGLEVGDSITPELAGALAELTVPAGTQLTELMRDVCRRYIQMGIGSQVSRYALSMLAEKYPDVLKRVLNVDNLDDLFAAGAPTDELLIRVLTEEGLAHSIAAELPEEAIIEIFARGLTERALEAAD